MDADLPTPDRVDLDPVEADAGTVDTGADDTGTEAPATVADDAPATVADDAPATVADDAPATDGGTGRLDLDAITADLEAVQVALERLGDGTYWTDEVTGEPLPDELLAASPTARRA